MTQTGPKMSNLFQEQAQFAEVLLPIKFKDSITYAIPNQLLGQVVPGSLVRVNLAGKSHTGVVREVTSTPNYSILEKIKPLRELTPFPPMTPKHLEFLDRIANYYLCTPGEVFRAAVPSTVKALKRKKSSTIHHTEGALSLPQLSDAQEAAKLQIQAAHSKGKTVLLNGVTGSGKTEIYIHLAAEALRQGKNVLYLVPEIALSRQLEHRLERTFGDQLLVYHSKQTAARRRMIYETLAEQHQAFVTLGLRSALFLPFNNLGLVIVDEEHDTSYKQKEPAPRYNGRDAALFLANIHQCPVILGSATPSFESQYNVLANRYQEVRLTQRHFGGEDCPIHVVDMRKERRKRAVKGAFSFKLLKAIQDRLQRGEQCLIFRSRRAYATWIECPDCGYVPKCPHCNISLSFHKAAHSLSCHYCGYTIPAQNHCPVCPSGTLQMLGNGTERLEEELKELLPHARIARFDAETTQNKADEQSILQQYENKEIDILIGTQMIAKGFDFPALTLTAIIQAEAMTSLFDFRADERSIQLLSQLRGRAGRRDLPGEMIIQTTQPEKLEQEASTLLAERKIFGFPPYVRMILLTLKHTNTEQLNRQAQAISQTLSSIQGLQFSGPTTPPVDRIQGEYLVQYHIKINRNRDQEKTKQQLLSRLQQVPNTSFIIDVDPL